MRRGAAMRLARHSRFTFSRRAGIAFLVPRGTNHSNDSSHRVLTPQLVREIKPIE